MPKPILTKPETKILIRDLRGQLEKCLEEERDLSQKQSTAPYKDRFLYDMLLDPDEPWPWHASTPAHRKQEIERQLKAAVWQLNKLNGKVIEGQITDADITQAKSRPISDLFAGKLTRSGQRLTGKCPFHDEKTGSFVIYTNQNSWWCFGCSEGGSVVDFVMKQQNLKFIDAINYLLNNAV